MTDFLEAAKQNSGHYDYLHILEELLEECQDISAKHNLVPVQCMAIEKAMVARA
jgi:hypothetical protein